MPDWYARSSRDPVVRLLLIPAIVYMVWLFETYLLGEQGSLITRLDSSGIFLYTFVCCILIGMVVPVLIIRRSFMAGDVTMFHLGFRSWNRTMAGIVFSFLTLGVIVTIYNPPGCDMGTFFLFFMLLLPTAIASAMICWLLIGTHLQALVRDGGPLISIPAGVAVTAILFGLALKALLPLSATPEVLFWQIIVGMIVAVMYFLIRDIWPITVLVTMELVYLVIGLIPASELYSARIPIMVAAVVSTGALMLVHWYFLRYFRTIPAPVT